MDRLRAEIKSQGLIVLRKRKYDFAMKRGDKANQVLLPRTPSSQRTIQNKIAELKRKFNFQWPRRGKSQVAESGGNLDGVHNAARASNPRP